MHKIIAELYKNDIRFAIGFTLLCFCLILVLISFFSPYNLTLWNTFEKDLPPSVTNPLGTNSMGQDIFWKATVAIRNSLFMALISSFVSRIIALSVGLSAGYKGGKADTMLMSINDSFIIIPLYPILILVSSILKEQLTLVSLGVVLGLFGWAWDARLFRSQILSLRERPFSYTARLSGMSDGKIILREHIPFLIPLILAATLQNIFWAIGMEVTLAILGLSSLNTPTLGTMLYWANSRQALFLGAYNWLFTPIILSIFIILGVYLFSISVNQYLDPRTRIKRLHHK